MFSKLFLVLLVEASQKDYEITQVQPIGMQNRCALYEPLNMGNIEITLHPNNHYKFPQINYIDFKCNSKPSNLSAIKTNHRKSTLSCNSTGYDTQKEETKVTSSTPIRLYESSTKTKSICKPRLTPPFNTFVFSKSFE